MARVIRHGRSPAWVSLLLATSLSALSACGGSSPSPTAVPVVSATYAGTIQDSVYGSGTVRASLSTAFELTTGTFTMSFPEMADLTVYPSGTLAGSTYHANLSPCTGSDALFSCNGGCTLVLDSSLTPTAWSGHYVTIVTPTCPARSGTIASARQ